jgi:hypothetical protein
MGKKGIKSRKGQGESWDEAKTERINVQVTKTCKRLIKEQAHAIGTSISEFLERVSRKKLDEDELIQSVKARPLDAEQVKTAITRFSKKEWINIAKLCLELLDRDDEEVEEKAENTKPITIAELVKANRDACIEMFEGVVLVERVDDIISGVKPTQAELELLGAVLPVSFERLEQIFRRDFGNGNNATSHSANHN